MTRPEVPQTTITYKYGWSAGGGQDRYPDIQMHPTITKVGSADGQDLPPGSRSRSSSKDPAGFGYGVGGQLVATGG